ncbi:uncharacterized protein [Littorina saxatilis]|uniref:Autophagy-related protein 27 n=1 Tax=Littorina saxatilis TaxID=31220 RepID=A0AAN9BSN4_9CAEN
MVAAMLFYRYQRALCVVIVAVLWPWREGPALFADGQVQCQAKTDVCGCVFDDGSGTIDVSSLANTDGTPRFQTVPGGPHNETYYYNPCTPFNKVTCSEAAVCVVNANGENATQVGDAETATWIYQAQGQGGVNASVLIANYQHRGSDFISQSFVKFVCDPSASTPTFELENDDNNVYYFTLTSKCACPNAAGCSSGGNTSGTEGQMSTGSYMLILLFVAIFVYLAAGMVFNSTQRHATGLELVPNVTFWRAVPGYIKDGCMFATCNVCGRWKGTYQEIN